MGANALKKKPVATITFKELKRKARSQAGIKHKAKSEAHGLLSVIKSIKDGFPISVFERLKNRLEIPEKELAEVVNIAPRTLVRRKKDGRLHSDESERILRIANLFERAIEVVGSEEEARKWFKLPNFGLGDVAPLKFADTEPGAREVEDLLGRIEWGLFS